MVLNVIQPTQTRYIALGDDLEDFLKEKYGKDHPNFDFNIEHVCDRWIFEAPEKVEEEEIRRLIDEVEGKENSKNKDRAR